MNGRIDIKRFQQLRRFYPFWISIFLPIVTISPNRHSATKIANPLSAQREAEARAAIAETERAELVARLPPSSIKPLQGGIDTRQFGAAGLVNAFDLARDLAAEVCAALPADRKPPSTSRLPPRASWPRGRCWMPSSA